MKSIDEREGKARAIKKYWKVAAIILAMFLITSITQFARTERDESTQEPSAILKQSAKLSCKGKM
jgi:hypothetical protein